MPQLLPVARLLSTGRHGAALALPETVALARPEGLEHALPTIEVEDVAEMVELLRAA